MGDSSSQDYGICNLAELNRVLLGKGNIMLNLFHIFVMIFRLVPITIIIAEW